MLNSVTEQDENIRTVSKLYDAFKRHYISSLLDMFTDDAILHGPTTTGVVSCHGGLLTRSQGVAEFFTAVGESLKPQQFELRDFIAQGNRVAVFGYQKGQAKSLQDDHMRSSLYIYGQYMMENSQNSGYSMTQLPQQKHSAGKQLFHDDLSL